LVGSASMDGFVSQQVTSSSFFLSTLNYDARSTTHQTYIYCCVYSKKLLMMNRGTVRNMFSFISKDKFEKLVYPVGYIVRRNICLLWYDAVLSVICETDAVEQPTSCPSSDYTVSNPRRHQSVLDLQRTCESLLYIDDGMTGYKNEGYPRARNKFAIVNTSSISCRSSYNVLP
jgi:hypothetical protein